MRPGATTATFFTMECRVISLVRTVVCGWSVPGQPIFPITFPGPGEIVVTERFPQALEPLTANRQPLTANRQLLRTGHPAWADADEQNRYRRDDAKVT
jgi:hypothetical protein